jgi:hypothetical protein
MKLHLLLRVRTLLVRIVAKLSFVKNSGRRPGGSSRLAASCLLKSCYGFNCASGSPITTVIQLSTGIPT